MHETPSKRKTCFEPFDPCHFSPAFDGVFNVSGVGRNMTGQIGPSAAATPPLWVALYFVPGSISEIVFAPFLLHSFCHLISSLGWREMRNPALHCKHGHEETLVLLCSLLSFPSVRRSAAPSASPPPISRNRILIRAASRFFISHFLPRTSRAAPAGCGRVRGRGCVAIRLRAPRSFVRRREGRDQRGGPRGRRTDGPRKEGRP